MRKTIMYIFIMFITASLLIACQSYKKADTDKSSPVVLETPAKIVKAMCKDPRAQACTREFRPVCATRDTGVRCVTKTCPSTERTTKPNACSACADSKVLSYTIGACE